MHTHSLERWQQSHAFVQDTSHQERRVLTVVAITFIMMIAEIVAGTQFGSMALLADGWHMATHASALSIAYVTYLIARKKAKSPSFSFGTGKVGALGGFLSAVGLAVVALFVGVGSIERMFNPVTVRFDEAMIVACLGLGINIVSVLVLEAPHAKGSADPNLASAYFHVLADALTSVAAILALSSGRFWGFVWMDPAVGLLGALIIARWSYGLIVQTVSILLDLAHADTAERIRTILEDGDVRIADLHVWSVSPNHQAAIVAIVTHEPKPPDFYKEKLAFLPKLAHVSIEINACPGVDCRGA
jgi:cation diffusion facilitator family transporter